MNHLDTLPKPKKLMKLMKIHASLNIVLCPEECLRYHSFLPNFYENVPMAKIDNGAGDHLFILFSSQGTILKGFDHESELSPYAQEEHKVWPGIYEGVPKELLSLLDDEAIEIDDVTFCIWREVNDSAWQKGEVEIPEGEADGSGFLVGTIFHTAEDFVDFANGYFEITLPSDIVANIYDGVPITAEMIKILNPECDVAEALKELELLS